VSEPVWITDREAVALNQRLIALFGGLEAARATRTCSRPPSRARSTSGTTTIPGPICSTWAAAYAFAIARWHVFLDGNKRTAHALAAVFLANNGFVHVAAEDEVIAVMVARADGSLSEAELAAWLRQGSA
jgi:death-on-curing protein